jgi:hypothetical protein
MVSGADSIDDMDSATARPDGPAVHPGAGPVDAGNVAAAVVLSATSVKLDAVAAGLLARLATTTPVLRATDQVVFVDVDDTVRQTYGYAKHGAGRGYTGIERLNALLAVISTPLSAPLIATSNTPSGHSSRPWAGPRPKLRTPGAADRWTWLIIAAIPSYGWPARWPAICAAPGRNRPRGAGSPRPGSRLGPPRLSEHPGHTTLPACAPKPSRPGLGRRPGSRNRSLHPLRRRDDRQTRPHHHRSTAADGLKIKL